jgi:hypothetical protein
LIRGLPERAGRGYAAVNRPGSHPLNHGDLAAELRIREYLNLDRTVRACRDLLGELDKAAMVGVRLGKDLPNA